MVGVWCMHGRRSMSDYNTWLMGRQSFHFSLMCWPALSSHLWSCCIIIYIGIFSCTLGLSSIYLLDIGEIFIQGKSLHSIPMTSEHCAKWFQNPLGGYKTQAWDHSGLYVTMTYCGCVIYSEHCDVEFFQNHPFHSSPGRHNWLQTDVEIMQNVCLMHVDGQIQG